MAKNTWSKGIIKLIDNVAEGGKRGLKRLNDGNGSTTTNIVKRVKMAIKSQPDDVDNILKKLKEGDIATTPEIKRNIRHKLPHKTYAKSKFKADKLANKIGFKNENDFFNFIQSIKDPSRLTVEQATRLSKVFKHFSKLAKKHPLSTVKLAVIGGTITAMVIFLKRFQQSHTGCFRYNGEDDVKRKFKGSNFCVNDDNDNDDVELISEEEHPLYNVKNKWDCKFSNFKSNAKVDGILSLGCNGLCDWENFNVLASYSNSNKYKPIDNIGDEHHEYLFKCEKMTFLRAISTSTSNAFNELFFDSNFGKSIIKSIIRIFIIIILIFFLYNFIFTINKKI